MKCLTPKETSRWIREQGLVENLFVDAAPSNGGIRCDATMTYYGIECFLDVIFNQIMTEGDILIQATDWAPSREPREFIFGAVRHELGELRPLREAPSFLVPRAESLNAVAIFALMTSFRWKCYAYGDRKSTRLNSSHVVTSRMPSSA